MILALALSGAGCGGGGGDVVAQLESPERPAGDATDDRSAGDSSDISVAGFCAALEAFDGDEADDDPAAAASRLRALAAEAPDGVRDDLETLTAAFEELADLAPDSPEAVGEAFRVFLDPDVMQAAMDLEAFAAQECGFELDSSPAEGELPETGSGAGDDLADLSLEDLDRIEEDAEGAGATWPDKITSMTILNATDITLEADGSAGLTGDEALAACEAVRSDLVSRNPNLTVTVRSGGTVLAAAAPGGACAPA